MKSTKLEAAGLLGSRSCLIVVLILGLESPGIAKSVGCNEILPALLAPLEHVNGGQSFCRGDEPNLERKGYIISEGETWK